MELNRDLQSYKLQVTSMLSQHLLFFKYLCEFFSFEIELVLTKQVNMFPQKLNIFVDSISSSSVPLSTNYGL